MVDIYTLIPMWITSSDLLELILKFRTEMYVQELIAQCEDCFMTYDFLHENYLALHHYYEMIIIHYFRSVLEASDSSMYFQLNDLTNLFKSYGGQTTTKYTQIHDNYALTKTEADALMDDVPYLMIVQYILRIRVLNQHPETRSQITQEVIHSCNESITTEITRLEDKQNIIRKHSNVRLQMLQFIVRWIYNHTYRSWACWFKYVCNRLQSPEREIYQLLSRNRSYVHRFLSLKLV